MRLHQLATDTAFRNPWIFDLRYSLSHVSFVSKLLRGLYAYEFRKAL